MTKKILLIIGILAVVGVALFFLLGSTVKSGEGDSRVGFSIRDFLPFGKSDNTVPVNQGQSTGADGSGDDTNFGIPDNSNQPIPKLRKLSKEPVAGAVIFDTGSTSIVRFVEKGSGNVYEARSDSIQIERLTNTTIPKIIRSFWLPNGTGFLAQTIMPGGELVETNFIKLNKTSTSSPNGDSTSYDTTKSKLPTDIKEMSIKPDGSKIFYYTLRGSQSDWFMANPDGTQSTLLMTHQLSEWIPKWVSPTQIMMQNKSTSGAISYLYSFDIQSKILKKVGGGIAGLSANPNADWSLDLISIGGGLPRLFTLDEKNTSAQLNVASLADKCVWSKEKSPSVYCAIPNETPSGDYPDAWYKGIVTTDDSITKIDIYNSLYFNVSSLSAESGEKIDVVDPQINKGESYLIFRNKIDGYLWMLRLVE